jgi:hypothetical protein
VLSYNPILTISLCGEYLNRIMRNLKYIYDMTLIIFIEISSFKRDCVFIKKKLMLLGKKIVSNLEGDDIVEKIFLDKDFLNRTVLKIIIDNNNYKILSNHKIDELLNDIWHGKEFYKCNGSLADFSQLSYLNSNPLRVLPHKKIKLRDLLKNNFKLRIDKKYWF